MDSRRRKKRRSLPLVYTTLRRDPRKKVSVSHSRKRVIMASRRKRRVRREEKNQKPKLQSCEGSTSVEWNGMETVTGMEAWKGMSIPLPIIRALRDLKFTEPTEIQRRAIPVAMDTTSDVIGAAETGSGKTLAFAIPILTYIIANDARVNGQTKRTKRNDVMMTSPGKQRGRIIDLNLVYHSEEMEKEEEEEEEEEGVEKKEEEEEMEETQVSDIESETSLTSYNEGALKKITKKGNGLVKSLDNIPDNLFMKMIATKNDDIMPGSHDLTTTSHDQSHDLNPIALILTPTRELAMQIQRHILDISKYTKVKVCVLVGGMADERQKRLLNQHPPIVVATPGRLWKLMSDGHPYLTSLHSIRFLVLDEADRMIEFGHFQELSWILQRVNKGAGQEAHHRHRQTFVFSATLSLPRKSCEKKAKFRRKKNLSGPETIESLICQVGLKDDAAVVDVARATGTTETLSETKIMCSADDKFLYLYHFLLVYKGRTLVFVNSIATLQKLRSLLEMLRFNPLPLHARMQQRQRLKNFDRFSSCSEGLMLASDVAARGLDFPHINHVIHYDVPLNSELYVHRSGRTARAKREGLSLILIGPQEMTSFKNICKSLRREGLPTFPVDNGHLRGVHQRVSVARRLESIIHRRNKRKREKDWLQTTAQALELELDQDWHGTETDDHPQPPDDLMKEQELKLELEELLDKPVFPPSLSAGYPTVVSVDTTTADALGVVKRTLTYSN